jgi:hypothetical protein
MPLNRIALLLLCAVGAVSMALWQSSRTYAQPALRVPEQVAVFSVCGQALDAATGVQTKANAWFDNNRSVKVVQREMFTAPCPGATEFGSIAITIAIHYSQ